MLNRVNFAHYIVNISINGLDIDECMKFFPLVQNESEIKC